MNEWELICRECDEEFYVWQSCGCSEVDSSEFIEEGERGMQLSESEKAELAEVYEKAADAIEDRGWFHPTQNRDGKMCFVLALDHVGGYRLSNKACEFAADALELPGAFSASGRIYPWNDNPSRTADEVINTLHALANKLR